MNDKFENHNKSEQLTNKEELSEIASVWKENLNDNLETLFNEEGPDPDRLVNILWENGILDRISPDSERVRKARKELGKPVLDIERDDPELFWRLLYSAGQMKECLERDYTLASGSLVGGAMQGFTYAMSLDKEGNLFKRFKNNNAELVLAEVFDSIMDKARNRLENLGEEPHDNLIPWGASGKWRGMDISEITYTGDGLIYFKAKNEDDLSKLYELTGGKGVPPSEIDPSELEIEKEEQALQ